ncbi:MAG: hypothetical protein IPQ07_33445 [Myxococcales bacterium]|nr:hypothetical protein [Myxococcales bacterium]
MNKLAVVAALCVFGCGKDKGGSADPAPGSATAPVAAAPAAPPPVDPNTPCPALAVTVDGTPLSGLVHGKGVTMVSGSYTTHMVQLFNHDKSTCEEIVSGRRSSQPDEIAVKAFHGASPGVGIDVFTQVQGPLTLDKPADKVGEPLEICVRQPITFTPNAGVYNGKKVSIVGKFTGTFCGVNKS